MVTVTVFESDGRWEELEFEAVPRVGELVFRWGAYYNVAFVTHNFERGEVVQVEVDLDPNPMLPGRLNA